MFKVESGNRGLYWWSAGVVGGGEAFGGDLGLLGAVLCSWRGSDSLSVIVAVIAHRFSVFFLIRIRCIGVTTGYWLTRKIFSST